MKFVVENWPLGTSDTIAAASGLISFVALIIAIRAINAGNRNSASATLVAILEAFREGWARFSTSASGKAQDDNFADLLNLCEMCCAFIIEGSFSSSSKILAEDYMMDIVKILESNEYARGRLENLIHSPTTFLYLGEFRKRMKKRERPSLLRRLFRKRRIAITYSAAARSPK